MNLHALVMAGGGGTRFWPRSRTRLPKQFLTFRGDRSLLQGTIDRIAAQVPLENRWVITAAVHTPIVAEQLRELVWPHRIIGEPVGRDTAPCVGLGAALIAASDPDAAMLVMPADHMIEPEQEFRRVVHAAVLTLHDHPDRLITFGVPPTYPSTGYGYIHRGPALASRQGVTIYAATEFREKPDYATAENYVARGDYYWNSGIFLWRAAAILDELKRRKPAMHAAIGQIVDAWNTAARETVFPQEFATIERISIDYAVMQDAAREGRVIVVHAPFQWDDVGSWLALERHHPQDAHGNTVHGLHCGVDTYNSVIVSDDEHLIATVGVSDLVIVHCPDATLVTTRRHEADVKRLVEALKQRRLDRFL